MIARQAYAKGYENPSAIDAYFQQEQPRRDRSYLSRIYNFGREWLYEKPYEWLVRKPYIGFGLGGALLGALSGLAFGPFGALFGAAVVGGMGVGAGTGLYWGWTRGERKPGNPKWLDGRSIGKYAADNWERWFPKRQAQTQLAYQPALI